MKNWKAVMLVVAVVLCLPIGAAAQDFPKGPITYMNPFNPGGEVDIAARAMQPYLEKILAQPFVINYLPGAGGGLCWSKLAAVKPDGYTIGGFSIPHIILQPIFMKDVTYKTDDFVILSIVEYTPIGLAVKKDFKVNSFKEFVEYAKANPGKISCGGVGKFTGHHFATLQFMKLAGVKVNYVTFQGTSQVQTAFMGGHIDAAFTNSSLLVTSRDQIKVLAIGSPKRMPQLTDIPTFEELGYKMYPRIARGAMGPKGHARGHAEGSGKGLPRYDLQAGIQSQDGSRRFRAAGHGHCGFPQIPGRRGHRHQAARPGIRLKEIATFCPSGSLV